MDDDEEVAGAAGDEDDVDAADADNDEGDADDRHKSVQILMVILYKACYRISDVC